jgi:hypothetical protein
MAIGKALIGLTLLLLAGSAARADDFETYARPKLRSFINCVVAEEDAAAKSSAPAPEAADKAIAGCSDRLDAFKAVLMAAPLNGSEADAEDAAQGAVEEIRPKVIERIGQLRGAGN